MSKRVISLLISLVMLCGVFACVPFSAFAEGELSYLYNKPFENDGFWAGNTTKITSSGYFSVVSSGSTLYYLVTKDTMSLGDEFEVNVTSVINNQNADNTRFSVFGVGDFAVVINPNRPSGASNNNAQFHNYAVVYNFNKTVAYSNSASNYTGYIADGTVVASGTEIKSASGGYITTLPITVALADGVLSVTINGELVASVTEADMAALDDTFTGFNFDDIKIGMSLKHTYKVYENGAYFKNLSIAAAVTPAVLDGLIANLPDSIAIADEFAVNQAASIYDAMSDADKAQVTNIDKLNAARVAIVEAYIDAIPDGVVSTDAAQVDECFAKFNALPVDLQAEVNNADKLNTAVGQMGVIDVIESIAAIGDVNYDDVYAYASLSKDIAKLSEIELSFVHNYNTYVEIGNKLNEFKNNLEAADIIEAIANLPVVTFTPNNAAAYNTQIQNIDLDYVAQVEEIRAIINVYGKHSDIINYSTFLDKELALIDAMEAFNELADADIVFGTHKYNYKGGVEGEYVTFPENTVIYSGDTVYIKGLNGCNSYAPNGFYTGSTLYNVVYRYNNGSESTSFQPVNGANKLNNLKVGNYKVYHKSWSDNYSTYLLVEFNVVERPTYNYDMFDVATMLDHMVFSYDDVVYADKQDVEKLWKTYDEMDVFIIDDVHTIRNLVDADKYFEAVEDGTIVEEEDTSDVVIGDVNRDGQIDSTDALVISQYLIGVGKLSTAQLKAANVNQSADGKITSADYLLLVNYCLGRSEI